MLFDYSFSKAVQNRIILDFFFFFKLYNKKMPQQTKPKQIAKTKKQQQAKPKQIAKTKKQQQAKP